LKQLYVFITDLHIAADEGNQAKVGNEALKDLENAWELTLSREP